MDDMQGSADSFSGEQPKTKASKTKRIKGIILLVFVIGALGGLGFLYMRERNELSRRDSDLATLRGRIDELEGDVAEVVPTEGGPTAVTTCNGGSSYTAEIGRFKVLLDSPRVVIRKLDAGFEGGPITSLQIGSCLPGASNVVDLYPTHEVNIIAHPSSSSADLKAQYESSSGAPLTGAGTLTIAGETAQKYTQDGLFSVTVLYFDHGGIGYQIELPDTNTQTNATLSDLTSDWSFTP